MKSEFAGKTIVVTGGAQGIGKCITLHFLSLGAGVCVIDIDRAAIKELRDDTRSSKQLLTCVGDVSRETDVRRAFAGATRRFGRIDVVCNNAGIMDAAPLEKLSLKAWNRIIGVNLTGAFLCARQAARHLRTTRGAIVNIASTRAFMSEPNTEAYAASKGGIVALTHALAVTLGPKVRVNCIAPGWIEVSDWKKTDHRIQPQLRPEDHAQHPAGRVGKPSDIAALVEFLASSRAGFITGACFTADGGMTHKMIYC